MTLALSLLASLLAPTVDWPMYRHDPQLTGRQPVPGAITQPAVLWTVPLAGEDGYWTNFNWDNAFRLAEPITGLKYSGSYGFAETLMYWPTTHMVLPKENALQCTDCHAENGRLDWEALGYPGDPMEWGGRFDR